MLKSGATCVRKCFKIGLPSSWFRQTEVTIGENIKLMTTKEIVAAGPVSRILSAGRNRQDGHSSRPRIAARLKRPTRRFDAPSRHVPRANPKTSSLFGLAPCGVYPACRIAATAVRSYRTFSPLPSRFPISSPCGNEISTPAGRYVFCGTFRQSRLNATSRMLSGTLLSGVRTFLSPHPKAREATVRSSCQQASLYSMMQSGNHSCRPCPRSCASRLC